MAQPLCSALHTLCGHLEPPPTSDQGLEGTPGVNGTQVQYKNEEW